MSAGTPFQPHQLCISKSNACSHQPKLFEVHGRSHFLNINLSSRASRQDQWTKSVSCQINRPLFHIPYRYNAFICQSFSLPDGDIYPILKSTVSSLSSSVNALCGSPLLLKLFPAFGAIGFAIWGLEPLIRHSRNFFFHRNDASWKKSATYYVSMSYLKPLFLWSGAMVACRVLDPVVLTSEASQIVKQRLVHFVRSLSTVLAFSYCLSSLIEQMQKFIMDTNVNSNDARNMGFQFAGKAVYTAIWVAAVSLFMELLGFSTQKWLTAGGLGTVLLTLAGREIFTNFLSSIMIHATRPFVVNEWIQTKIEGYDVSGTVEHVGWWSPTIIRGEDREAIHIPNHKFTMNVVRNLTQKTHWRIKTHLAISHLDANKISNIVADMRKVMSKNPQVEQQRLHRRVFLEYINPENQAFMILISCFVKTSHFEEYLCVKEAILLDLLRVISHHRARLATPIRTVQKMYGDVDLENVPFADTIFTHGRAPIRNPLYLIDSTARINGEDKPKSRSSTFANEEHLKSTSASDKRSTNLASDGPLSDKKRNQKMTSSGDSSLVSEDPLSNNLEDNHTGKKLKTDNAQTKSTAPDRVKTMSTSSPKTQVEGSDGKDANSVKPTVKSSDSTQLNMSNGKESEKFPSIQQPTKKSSLEENIVLGVALDGAKRTLPIDEGIDSPPLEPTKELAALAKGNGSAVSTKDKKDGSASMVADEKSTDVQDQEMG